LVQARSSVGQHKTLDGKKGKSEVKTLIVSAVLGVLACMTTSIAEVGAKTPGRHSAVVTAKPNLICSILALLDHKVERRFHPYV
jgi:hypothetical protein